MSYHRSYRNVLNATRRRSLCSGSESHLQFDRLESRELRAGLITEFVPAPVPLEDKGTALVDLQMAVMPGQPSRFPGLTIQRYQGPSISLEDGVLKVTGTADNDRIAIFMSDDGTGLVVRSGSGDVLVEQKFDVDQVRQILVHGMGGDDLINLRGVLIEGTTDQFSGAVTISSVLCGDDGNDTILGGAASDQLFGGVGNDWLDGNDGDDVIAGQEGRDWLHGSDGNDQVWGNSGNDRLSGGAGYDMLAGGQDDDIIEGDAGADLLYGGNGNDCLHGGAGTDSLFGGNGNDRMTGNEGRDLFFGDDGIDIVLDLDGTIGEMAWLKGPTDPDYGFISTLKFGGNRVAEIGNEDSVLNSSPGVYRFQSN